MIPRPAPFCLTVSDQGSFIVNRNDACIVPGGTFGVGHQLFQTSSFDRMQIDFVKALLGWRRHHFGDGVVALDCGANIGVCTVEWAKFMAGWGQIHAFEAQEFIFYALGGNIALNNCLNASARHCALDSKNGRLRIPQLDLNKNASFGSLELKQLERAEYIGQSVDYGTDKTIEVEALALDSLSLPRVDLIKIDVEGMEMDVLQGTVDTLRRLKPIVWIEVLKSNADEIERFLCGLGYDEATQLGSDALVFHSDDPTRLHCRTEGDQFLIDTL